MVNFLDFELLDYLILPFGMLLIGFWGLVGLRKSLILLLIYIELLLLAINLFFVLYSVYLDDVMGQIFVLFILTVAGGESAIGLAILVSFYRLQSLLSIDLVSFIKG